MSEEEIKKPLTKEELSLIRELVYAEKVFDMSFQNIAKKLLNEVDLKETQLQQKENTIKEVREYLDIDESIRKNCKRYDVNGIAILEILDKGETK